MSVTNDAKEQHCLIVGLGNPESKYMMTRHNIGFLVVQALADSIGATFSTDKKCYGKSVKQVYDGVTVRLLLPETYMNNSGMSVRRCLDYYGYLPEQIMVVADTIDLDFGDIRIRTNGSAGGHNGLKSIEEMLGTREYSRMRIGVGDRENGELSQYVLGRFSEQETKLLPDVISNAVSALRRWLVEDVGTIMNEVNVKRQKRQKENKEEPREGNRRDDNG